MRPIARLLIREIREVVPPTVFFFLSFLLLLATQTLVLEEHGIEFYDFSAAAIGALVVGKVVLIADKFRVVDQQPCKAVHEGGLHRASRRRRSI